MSSVESGDGRADVDVVFLVWREDAEVLARHHLAVAAALPEGWSGKAVLVENASPSPVSRAARDQVAKAYPGARRVVVRLPRNYGFGRAVNLGLAECEGSYAVLMNSDGRPEPELISALVAALEAEPDAVWAAPAVHGSGEDDQPRGPVERVEELAGTALAIRRQAFLALGGFDPLFFFYSEDFDASRRIRAAGGGLLRVPGTRFSHDKDGRSARGVLVRELLYAAGYQTLLHVHEPSRVTAARRLARIRRRALSDHATDRNWPALAGIAAATLAWPVTTALAERRRRHPWDGAALAGWLRRHRRRASRTSLAPDEPAPQRLQPH